METDGREHRVFVVERGQYVVVEVASSPDPLSYRGKVVVRPHDRVTLGNTLRQDILLLVPFMEQVAGDEPRAPVAPALEPVDAERDRIDCHVIKELELHVCALAAGSNVTITIPKDAAEGHYEYGILHRAAALEGRRVPPAAAVGPAVVSTWAHAFGGSSAEFIIRRSSGGP